MFPRWCSFDLLDIRATIASAGNLFFPLVLRAHERAKWSKLAPCLQHSSTLSTLRRHFQLAPFENQLCDLRPCGYNIVSAVLPKYFDDVLFFAFHPNNRPRLLSSRTFMPCLALSGMNAHRLFYISKRPDNADHGFRQVGQYQYFFPWQATLQSMQAGKATCHTA